MKHLMAIWAYRPQVPDWVHLDCPSFLRTKRIQMVNMNVALSNISVCHKEIESAYGTNRAVVLNALLAVPAISFIFINRYCDLVAFGSCHKNLVILF